MTWRSSSPSRIWKLRAGRDSPTGPTFLSETGVAAAARGPGTNWQRALPFAWAAFLALLVTLPWLQPGYIFGTDWPGPRRFDLPHDLTSTALLQVALAVVSRVLPAEVTGKLLVVSILFVAALTAYEAAPTTLKIGFVPRAAASILYVFNPFVFGRLHYGQLFLLAGYAVLPWVALRLRRLVLNPRVIQALIAAVSLALLGILSLHLLVVAGVLAVALVLTHTLAAKDRVAYLMRLGPVLLLMAAATLAASAYWVVPLVTGRGPEGTVISGIGAGDLAAYAASPDPQLGLLPNLLGLYGFWAEGTGRFTAMKHFVPLWPVALGLLILVCAAGAVTSFRRNRDEAAPWVAGLLVAAAVGLVLEAGISQPITAVLVRWLDAIPIYRGMRDAGKYAALLALVYSQLFALGAAAVLDRIRTERRPQLNVDQLHGIATGLLLALPLFYGNGLLFGMHGEIRPSQYPSGWYAADQYLQADGHPGRTLFLPWHEYMAYSFVRNQNRVVASPAPTFFSSPMVVSADPEVPGIEARRTADQVAISGLVSSGANGKWADVLATRDVKYVLLAREVDWKSYSYLDQQIGLHVVSDYDSIILYRNTLVH
ncbi:MAG TPA: hypothetical protein VJP81_11165 [Candidatus Dormibacteraeota bacterium]|nr:hypothetical protein [Candidatus Dormibacteraeota bacterium]